MSGNCGTSFQPVAQAAPAFAGRPVLTVLAALTSLSVQRFRTQISFIFAFVFLFAAPCRALHQAHHDPLTPEEADQVQNASDDYDKRIGLFLTFARQRLAAFEATRRGNAPDRSDKMYQLLEEYSDIIHELDQNLDTMMSGHVTGEMSAKPKLRKPVEATVQAENQFLADLKRIKTTSSPGDLQSYHFQLDDSISVTQDSVQNAQQDLTDVGKREQNEKQQKQLEKKRQKEEKEEQKLEKKRQKQQKQQEKQEEQQS